MSDPRFTNPVVEDQAVEGVSQDHAELARLAEAATAGPWFHRQPGGDGAALDWIADHPDHGRHQKIICHRHSLYGGADDYAFIAAANPARVLALLAEIAALRVDLSRKHDACQIAQEQAMENGSRATQAERQRDEAVGLIRELIEPYEQFDGVQLFQVVNNGLATRITSARTFLDSMDP